MLKETIYQTLPVALQNAACSAYGWRERRIRLGPEFQERYRWLLATEEWSRDRIEEYQDAEIAAVVRHAYETVPYYRRVMDDRRLKPADIATRADLTKLPPLRKEDVALYKEDLVSRAVPRGRLRSGKTSGTTGKALSFYNTAEAVAFQWAVWWRHRARFGIRPLTWHLNFTGKLVVPMRQTRPPYWRWNWPMRQALINMQHIAAHKIEEIAAFAGRHEFRFFSGYPSIVHRFATLIEAGGIHLARKPEVIFLGAEDVQEFQRRTIERVTGARITDQYGVSEGCGNASRCERGPYHEDWEFGTLEAGDKENNPDGSIRGRILATGFANRAFPLIRYEIGDAAVWEPESFRCDCGRQSMVIRHIEGRNEDYVVTPEGLHLMRFDYLFKDTTSIREAQVVQRNLGGIVIRIVARSPLSPADEAAIRKKVFDWISPGLRVEFERVDELSCPGEKFRPVVSELHIRPLP